jgi:hypothetical protein
MTNKRNSQFACIVGNTTFMIVYVGLITSKYHHPVIHFLFCIYPKCCSKRNAIRHNPKFKHRLGRDLTIF